MNCLRLATQRQKPSRFRPYRPSSNRSPRMLVTQTLTRLLPSSLLKPIFLPSGALGAHEVSVESRPITCLESMALRNARFHPHWLVAGSWELKMVPPSPLHNCDRYAWRSEFQRSSSEVRMRSQSPRPHKKRRRSQVDRRFRRAVGLHVIAIYRNLPGIECTVVSIEDLEGVDSIGRT